MKMTGCLFQFLRKSAIFKRVDIHTRIRGRRHTRNLFNRATKRRETVSPESQVCRVEQNATLHANLPLTIRSIPHTLGRAFMMWRLFAWEAHIICLPVQRRHCLLYPRVSNASTKAVFTVAGKGCRSQYPGRVAVCGTAASWFGRSRKRAVMNETLPFSLSFHANA
jgi:hypothetical protein